MSPFTRAEAQSAGVKRYGPVSTCKHGHFVERLTINGSCVECSRVARVKKYAENPSADLARQKLYRQSVENYALHRKEKRHAANPDMHFRVVKSAEDLGLRANAKVLGSSIYVSCRTCQKCNTSSRFTGDGHCVECNRHACLARHQRFLLSTPGKMEEIASKKLIARQRAEKKVQASIRASVIRSARQNAIVSGALTYTGRACKKGHIGLRYTNHGTCAACAKEMSTSVEKKAYDKIYTEKNKARILKRMRVRYAANPQIGVATSKRWALENPERVHSIKQNYKHRRRAQEDSGMSGAELNRWKQAQKKICYWCLSDCSEKYAVDHYYPLSKGGKHEASNLVIACKSCNSKKSAKDPAEFAVSIGKPELGIRA